MGKKAFAVVLIMGVSVLGVAFGAVSLRAAFAGEAESTESLLRSLETSAPEAQATAETRSRARAALERARRFRETGDEPRARLADGLAQRLAELARDQARAVRAEHGTAAALRDAEDAGAQADRERAMVEEALAQGGRLRAQLESFEAERKKEPERTATRALASDAGAPAPKAPPKKDLTTKRDGGAP